MDLLHGTVLFVAAVCGGAVNSVAGGGTLLTFPALVWAGQLEIIANATNTVALWPGALSSFWGYRGELKSGVAELVLLAVPSFLGGVAGALLLLVTPNAIFAALVPYLVLTATILFMAQEPLARWRERRNVESSAESGVRIAEHAPSPPSTPGTPHFPTSRWAAVIVYQFVVGVYGGYFGAGIGILMLAAFAFLGYRNIHHMNALKNLNGMCINGIAAVMFIVKGLVEWRLALLMAVGAIIGGYAGAGTARRVGQKNVRRMVICIGLGLTAWLLLRQMMSGGR